ncbi:MAG TPA: hypothetical protein P5318_19240 [Candidatus Hydrogenedentes bacterium]|nr:hypothetical protein [Candidatus Hydrogenedentota bacterium]HRT22251.1 hypothetical protein [Candidatus Hydrogenedentota bacterium]HRT67007.1 hypothetical protein [Candidatus Hydrogenedentota bacterium]
MGYAQRTWTQTDYGLVAGIMCLMGGYYWAIRGTSGYGGETGGALAGFGWALLWYAFSQMGGAERRPYATPWMLVAITCGIMFGGFTGYGVYISWLNGKYCMNHPDLERAVPAWTGYAMLFLCGLHWGGNTGCFMAWCAPNRPLRLQDWVARIFCGVAGAVAALAFVRIFPQLFLPFYSEGVYNIPEYKTCQRALLSIQTIAPHVGSAIGFLAYEIIRRDRRAVAMILTLALGFAIPFTIGGIWQTQHGSPIRIDWWKNWEMSIGLGGGLAFGLAFWLFNRPADAVQPALGRWSRTFFRSGIPLWLPCIPVLQGCYDGWCEIHGVEPVLAGYATLFGLSFLPVLVLWARQLRHPPGGAPYRVPCASIMALQLLIVAAGVIVSIPRTWRFGNTFLAAAYTLYIGTSLCLLAILWKRNRAEN